MSALAKLVLANLKAADASGTGRPGVVPLIEEVLTLAPLSEDRRDRCFHPSDLSKDFCPRAWSLYNYHPDGYAVKERGVGPQLGRIFGNGHGVHHRLQGYLAQKAGVLFGSWKRLAGWTADEQPLYEHRHHTFRPGPSWTYDEVKLRNGDRRVKGSTDGLLRLDGRKCGLELKSINPEHFKWLGDKPQDAHLFQTYIYMDALDWMRRQSDAPGDGFAAAPLDGFWVVYECKGTQALKQFWVANDPAAVAAFFASVEKKMHRALEHERSGEHPACQCPPAKRGILCKTFPDFE